MKMIWHLHLLSCAADGLIRLIRRTQTCYIFMLERTEWLVYFLQEKIAQVIVKKLYDTSAINIVKVYLNNLQYTIFN